ncbi:MAG: ATP-binding protein [Ferrimicrobium sp.]
MNPAENPYSPGAGTPPPELTGRDTLIDQFRNTTERLVRGTPGQSTVLIGLRGVGKTVLLNVFEKQAESAGAVAEHLEADQDDLTPDVLARRMRSALYKLAPRDSWGRGTVARALGVVSSVYMTFAPHGVSFGVAVEPLTGMGDSGDLREDFIDLFVAVGEAAREHKRGVVLAIDEVQNLPDDVFRAMVMGLHRCSQLSLPVMAVGAGLPTVKGKAGDVKTYAERLFQFIEIGSLDTDDATRALVVPAEQFGIGFNGLAVDEILKRSQGYPYFLQEWGFGVWNSAEGPVISHEDVMLADRTVQTKLDESFFGVRMGRLTAQERQYLRGMADLGPGPHRSSDIAKILDMSLQRAAPIRGRLMDKGMIWSGEYGETAFTVPLFDEYLKRNVPKLER